MKNRVRNGIIVGVILYALSQVLVFVAGMEGPGTILFWATSVIIGVICGSLKWGFTIPFVLPLAFQLVYVLLTGAGGLLAAPDRIAAFLVMSGINSLIFGVLGAVAGLMGGRLIK